MGEENLELFAQQRRPGWSAPDAPLADRLRPAQWEDFEGLEGIDTHLLEQLKSGRGRPPSMILWGPPGSGKTTLAKLIGRSFDCHFVELSAVSVGVKEVRALVQEAKRIPHQTVLFMDEIHRFNRSQQDAFLPHVESGLIVLLGATTENPSFSLNSALLSRARVVVLDAHGDEPLQRILGRAANELNLSFEPAAADLLIQFAGGDARRLLNTVESFAAAYDDEDEGQVTEAQLQAFLQDAKSLFYDRSGEEHYNMASAFIKSMRGSDSDAALYWGFRMLESGEEPRFLIRRMIIFASEDIGNADPRALQVAVSTGEAFERIGMPEGRIPIAQCITYLATAPKSNRSYEAMHRVLQSIREHPKVSVPLHLRNAPTGLMKDLGYGKEYQYPHKADAGYIHGIRYLPDELGDRTFYEPSDRGYEERIRERLSWLEAQQVEGDES